MALVDPSPDPIGTLLPIMYPEKRMTSEQNMRYVIVAVREG
jgi:hypothetical protein